MGAGLVGLETADYLVEQGKEVVILEMLDTMAADTGNANRIYFEEKFSEKGVEVLLEARVTRVDEDGVVYVQKGWDRKLMGVDTVVLATGARAEDSLWKAVEGKRGVKAFAVGDCVEARNAMEAIYEGSKIAREI